MNHDRHLHARRTSSLRKKVLAHVATLGPDGAPQVTPVWVMLDGEDIIINTALGRAKARNLASDSRVAVSLTDPDDLYAAIVVRGSVTGFTTEGADDVIDQLAKSTSTSIVIPCVAKARSASPCASTRANLPTTRIVELGKDRHVPTASRCVRPARSSSSPLRSVSPS